MAIEGGSEEIKHIQINHVLVNKVFDELKLCGIDTVDSCSVSEKSLQHKSLGLGTEVEQVDVFQMMLVP